MDQAVDSARITVCPGCDNPAGFRRVGERGALRLLKCSQCGLTIADRTCWSDPIRGTDYYDEAHQPRETYPLIPSATDRDRVATITRHARRGRFLDFGGGLGRTALAASAIGFDVTVVEDSARAVAGGRLHHPEVDWIEGRDIPPETQDRSFDVVGMFHVLEHLPEPRTILAQVHRILRRGGLLVIEVPNWGSNLRRIQGTGWKYVVNVHVNYFQRSTLVLMVESLGYEVKTVEHRRTFAVNERHPAREKLKRLLCLLGFADILRCSFVRN